MWDLWLQAVPTNVAYSAALTQEHRDEAIIRPLITEFDATFNCDSVAAFAVISVSSNGVWFATIISFPVNSL